MSTSVLNKRIEKKNKKREKYHKLAKKFNLSGEPQFKEDMSDEEIRKVCDNFSFYRINSSESQSAGFLVAYMKFQNYADSDIEFLSNNKRDILEVDYGILYYSRLWMNATDKGLGNTSPMKIIKDKIEKGIVYILYYIKQKKDRKSESIKETKRITSMLAINHAICSIDSLVDDYICLDIKPKPKKVIEDYLNDLPKLSLTQSEEVISHCSDYIDSLKPEITHEEPAYTNNQITRIKTLIPILRKLIIAINETQNTKIKTKKKKLSPDKKKKKKKVKLEKVVYKETDEDFDIASISPSNVVGAKLVYLFDTKKKQLIVLVSLDDDGFSFSGSKITNVDIEKCIAKKIKKDIDIPKFIVDNPKSKIIAKVKKLKAKPAPTNKIRTRINENMIILKVFK